MARRWIPPRSTTRQARHCPHVLRHRPHVDKVAMSDSQSCASMSRLTMVWSGVELVIRTDNRLQSIQDIVCSQRNDSASERGRVFTIAESPHATSHQLMAGSSSDTSFSQPTATKWTSPSCDLRHMSGPKWNEIRTQTHEHIVNKSGVEGIVELWSFGSETWSGDRHLGMLSWGPARVGVSADRNQQTSRAAPAAPGFHVRYSPIRREMEIAGGNGRSAAPAAFPISVHMINFDPDFPSDLQICLICLLRLLLSWARARRSQAIFRSAGTAATSASTTSELSGGLLHSPQCGDTLDREIAYGAPPHMLATVLQCRFQCSAEECCSSNTTPTRRLVLLEHRLKDTSPPTTPDCCRQIHGADERIFHGLSHARARTPSLHTTPQTTCPRSMFACSPFHSMPTGDKLTNISHQLARSFTHRTRVRAAFYIPYHSACHDNVSPSPPRCRPAVNVSHFASEATSFILQCSL